MNAAIAARVLAAEHEARVLRLTVGGDSPRTATIRVPTCRRGGEVAARITWQPDAPPIDDIGALRMLNARLKALSRELGFRVVVDSEAAAAKPAGAPDLAWSHPRNTDVAIEAPGLSSQGLEA